MFGSHQTTFSLYRVLYAGIVLWYFVYGFIIAVVADFTMREIISQYVLDDDGIVIVLLLLGIMVIQGIHKAFKTAKQRQYTVTKLLAESTVEAAVQGRFLSKKLQWTTLMYGLVLVAWATWVIFFSSGDGFELFLIYYLGLAGIVAYTIAWLYFLLKAFIRKDITQVRVLFLEYVLLALVLGGLAWLLLEFI